LRARNQNQIRTLEKELEATYDYDDFDDFDYDFSPAGKKSSNQIKAVLRQVQV
jgi:hypothetical protein